MPEFGREERVRQIVIDALEMAMNRVQDEWKLNEDEVYVIPVILPKETVAGMLQVLRHGCAYVGEQGEEASKESTTELLKKAIFVLSFMLHERIYEEMKANGLEWDDVMGMDVLGDQFEK